jgi:hypothetical protein
VRPLNRRTLLLLTLGGAGTAALPSWAKRRADRQADLVATIAELIIPQTDTAGARAAGVPAFIERVIADADPSDRNRFQRGLESMDAQAHERYGTDFLSATPAQQIALLERISTTEFFTMFKTLTITGYYTSQVGMREELGDEGRTFFPDYVGCTHPEHGAKV